MRESIYVATPIEEADLKTGFGRRLRRPGTLRNGRPAGRIPAENPKTVISPWSDALDLFWHEHIPDTARYAADCQRIFGRFIQHDPHIGRDPYRHQSTIRSTMDLRAEQLRARQERLQRAKNANAVANDGFDTATWGCGNISLEHHGHDGHGYGHHGGHQSDGHSGHGGGHGGGHSCGGGHSGGAHSCGGGGNAPAVSASRKP